MDSKLLKSFGELVGKADSAHSSVEYLYDYLKSAYREAEDIMANDKYPLSISFDEFGYRWTYEDEFDDYEAYDTRTGRVDKFNGDGDINLDNPLFRDWAIKTMENHCERYLELKKFILANVKADEDFKRAIVRSHNYIVTLSGKGTVLDMPIKEWSEAVVSNLESYKTRNQLLGESIGKETLDKFSELILEADASHTNINYLFNYVDDDESLSKDADIMALDLYPYINSFDEISFSWYYGDRFEDIEGYEYRGHSENGYTGDGKKELRNLEFKQWAIEAVSDYANAFKNLKKFIEDTCLINQAFKGVIDECNTCFITPNGEHTIICAQVEEWTDKIKSNISAECFRQKF